MSDIKPIIDERVFVDMLGIYFDGPISDLAPIHGGMIAQVYSFKAGDKAYILRVTKDGMSGFEKERFIKEQIVSPKVPIPAILKTGQLDGLNYAISQKMPGQVLSNLSKAAYYDTLPSHMETLCTIHQSNVSAWSGYGFFEADGQGEHATWKRVISSIMDEEGPERFYGAWHVLFDTTFLDRGFFEAIYQLMLELLEYCPTERYLVHGDYDYTNVLAEDGQITGVLDWPLARYGDFALDIATIGFWRQGTDLIDRFQEFYTAQGMDMAYFKERVVCYSCYGGLDALRLFAKIDNRDAYDATAKILKSITS